MISATTFAITFAKPEWFFLLLVIPLVVGFGFFMRMRQTDRWKEIVADRLKAQLARTRSSTRFFIGMGLSMLGLILLIISLAMPENGEEWVEAREESRNILLCFDISQSMLTQDTGSGSRISAAKGAALEVIERFPADRIGLLMFSGETQVMVPLTIDHSFLNSSITQLDPIDLHVGGSNLAQAIMDSTTILTETGQRNNIMVVLSDGEDHSSGIEAAANTAASNGVFIYTLGFGSEEGGYIQDPRSRDGFFYDRRGNRVISQLKEESLREIANKTDGIYAKGLGGNFLDSLNRAVAKMDSFEQEGGHQRIAKPIYQWFLLPGLLLMIIAFVIQRLPMAAPALTTFIALLALPQPAEANELMDIREGKKAAQSGDHAEASRLFQKASEQTSGDRKAQLQLAAGSSAYQEKDWSAATQSFSQALLTENETLRQKAHYSLANTLFYEGRDKEEKEEQIKSWKGAMKHYEESLKIGDDTSAKGNLEALKKIIAQAEQEQQKQEQEQEESEDQEKDDQEKSEEEQEQESQEDKDEEGDEGEENQDQQDGETEDQDSQGNEEEDDPSKQGEEGEEGDKEKGDPENQEGEQSDKEGEPGNEDESENSGKGTEGEQSESRDRKDTSDREAEEGDPDQTPLERARRILREQADFGGKPPKARRRAYRRPEKDW